MADQGDRKERVKAMLRLVAGAGDGFIMGVKDAAAADPRLAAALKKDPGLLERVRDGIMDDFVPLYDSLDDPTVAAVTEFFSGPHGRAFAGRVKDVGYESARVLEKWKAKVELAMLSLMGAPNGH